jgi:hypothetical protein
MISSYNAAAQTVAVGSAYTFDTNRITTGCTVGHVPGTTTFTLTKPGYYYITFNTVFTTDATGEATVEIQNNGTVVPGATATETVATVGAATSMSISTIVRVLPSCAAIDNTAQITIVAPDLALNVSTAAINITKLC